MKQLERNLGHIVGDNIRRLRHGLGLSQYKLADMAGLSRSTIAALEGYRYDSADVRSLLPLAAALEVSVDELLTDFDTATLNTSIQAYLGSPWAQGQAPTREEITWLHKLPHAIWLGAQLTPESIAELIRWRRLSQRTQQ